MCLLYSSLSPCKVSLVRNKGGAARMGYNVQFAHILMEKVCLDFHFKWSLKRNNRLVYTNKVFFQNFINFTVID